MPHKKIEARFYHAAGGASPVLDWLRSLPIGDRYVIGQDLARVEFGWPVGMPLCRSLGSPINAAEWARSENDILCSRRRVIRIAWFCQENAEDPAHGFSPCPKTHEGGDVMAKTKKNPHRGSLVDDWLKEEGIFEDVTQKAIKEVQIGRAHV